MPVVHLTQSLHGVHVAGVTSPLRERRRQETADEIAAAALDLADRDGWAAVTADDIAAAAGVSRRTFFNYFPSKDDALLHSGHTWDEDALERFATSTGPLLPALEELLGAQSALMAADRDRFLRVMGVVEANPELLPRMLARFHETEQVFATAYARRDPAADDLRAQAVAAVVGALLRVSAHEWVHDPSADPQRSVRRVLDALRALTA